MPLTLLIGGARSGKTRLAIELAQAAASSVTFLATGEARDDEMAERIRRHQLERREEWTTVEEPRALGQALAQIPAGRVVVIDCLTLWVANLLEAELTPEAILAESAASASAAAARAELTIAVSNEVGLGIVPASPLGRSYRDLLGQVNARWAAAADRSLFVIAGRALQLHDALESLR